MKKTKEVTFFDVAFLFICAILFLVVGLSTNELENTYLKIGEKIEIIYSPNDPRIFIYPNNNSGNMLYLISAMFGLFGLLGLGIKLS